MKSHNSRFVAAGLLSAIIALAFGFPSCSRSGPAPAKGAEDVIAAESFLADIVRNVAGDRLSVGTLVPPETDPHEYQSRPQDFARIRAAKLFVTAGAGYEAWLASAAGALQGVDEFALFEADSSGDPHFWTDPRNTAAALPALAEALAKVAPDAKAAFEANAQRYATELLALDSRIRARFSVLPAGRRLLLTNHDSLGHFAAAYGFRVVGTVLPGTSTEAAPSAKGLSELVAAIKSVGALAIFLDVGENRSLADAVAKETGVRVVTDLYVEGTSAADGPAPTYVAMLEHDAEAVADALK